MKRALFQPLPDQMMGQFFLYRWNGKTFIATHCQGYWQDLGRIAFLKEIT